MPLPVSDTVTQQVLAGLRAVLTALTFGSPYLDAAEQLRANHHAHECQDPVRLARWLVNTQIEIARRAAAAQQSKWRYVTHTQRELLRALLHLPAVSRARSTQVLLGLNRLTQSDAAAELRQLWGLVPVDGVANDQDRRRAATFRPAESLTYAALSQTIFRPGHA